MAARLQPFSFAMMRFVINGGLGMRVLIRPALFFGCWAGIPSDLKASPVLFSQKPGEANAA